MHWTELDYPLKPTSMHTWVFIEYVLFKRCGLTVEVHETAKWTHSWHKNECVRTSHGRLWYQFWSVTSHRNYFIHRLCGGGFFSREAAHTHIIRVRHVSNGGPTMEQQKSDAVIEIFSYTEKLNLKPSTETFWKTLLWLETVLHQDQHLMTQECLFLTTVGYLDKLGNSFSSLYW